MKLVALAAAALLSLFTISLDAKVKNAEKYGFLPSATPEQNSTALQKCVEGGGDIRVTKPGTYRLCKTILLDSDTDLTFGKGVIICRDRDSEGVSARHVFLNRGALDRTWNENISIRGLHLLVNGLDGGDDIPKIVGLRGHVAFFYARDITLEDITIPDLMRTCFGIHICTFENASLDKLYVEGMKDAVHFGPGKHFSVKNGVFKTYDDPIALNAHDYPTSNPEMGWIEDGLIENCTDLDDPERGTTGFFARILAGAWCDWREGMPVQINGDAAVSEGRIYRTIFKAVDSTLVSTCRPVHKEGTVKYPDGVTWVMSQDQNVCHSCGVRNVTFRNIHLQKKRRVALSLHFDTGRFSRSYYPGAEIPVQENIVFDKVFVEADIPNLISAITPVNTFSLINSKIGKSRIHLSALKTEGMKYEATRIVVKKVECDDIGNLVNPTTRPYKVEME